jgi:sugar (pentulose or hexulose) kinase
MWIKNNEPEVWNKTYKFMTPKDFVIYKLTGENIIDYSSAGNIGGVFDIHKKYWSQEMCEILGIDLDKLPEKIVKSSDIVGTMSGKYAQETGLLEGTPIIAGGIDAPVAQLSAGAVYEGEHVAMVGTSTCWGNIHDGKYLTPELVSYPYVVDDLTKIYTFGGGATSGAIIRWFREEFGEYEKEYENKRGVSAYTLLELGSKDIPAGSDGIIVLPYFMGERSPIWDSKAKGTIIGLSLYHNRNHLYKAFMEAVAYSLRHNIEEAQNAGIVLDPECYLVGGTAKSDIWTQIFSDVTGYVMKRTKQDVEAPLGDAFLAGLGTGIFKQPEDIKKWTLFKEDTLPNNSNKQIYDKYFNLYKQLYKNTKEIMEQL